MSDKFDIPQEWGIQYEEVCHPHIVPHFPQGLCPWPPVSPSFTQPLCHGGGFVVHPFWWIAYCKTCNTQNFNTVIHCLLHLS